MNKTPAKPLITIACGGTGGHIFPAIAIGGELRLRGCDVTLLISPKEIDQQAVRNVAGLGVAVLPAVGLGGGNKIQFLRSFLKSFGCARKMFRERKPRAVLAMGGFTAAPPVLAAWLGGVPAFLHDSNTVPGRANRLLARFVRSAFLGFPEAAARLNNPSVVVTGTPVRPQFRKLDPRECRTRLGLDADRPVALVMGGSQGATAVNDLALQALPRLAASLPELQWLHLTGAKDFARARQEHAKMGGQHSAVVLPFLAEMELALGAATAAVSRSGASSLAEIAALRLPALLIPFPAAVDDHQLLNARAFERTDAACVLEQSAATPETFAGAIRALVTDASLRNRLQEGLGHWHTPDAAVNIAEKILAVVTEGLKREISRNAPAADSAARSLMLCVGGVDRQWSGFTFGKGSSRTIDEPLNEVRNPAPIAAGPADFNLGLDVAKTLR